MKLASARIVGSVSHADYRRQDAKRGDRDYCISRSDLVQILECPHRWRAGYQTKDTDAKDYGRLLDCLFLTPDRFDGLYAVPPPTCKDAKDNLKDWDFRSAERQKWREQQHEGCRNVVTGAELAEARAALNALKQDYECTVLMDDAQTQVMVCGIWEDDGIEIPIRGLIDIVPSKYNSAFRGCLADFKTCAYAGPDGWPRTVKKYGYHIQAALYLDLFCAATGEDRTEWLHLCQENYWPFEIGRREMSQRFLDLGRFEYRHALRVYADCIREDFWPQYDDSTPNVRPGWTLTEPEEWMLAQASLRLPQLRGVETPLVTVPECQDLIP